MPVSNRATCIPGTQTQAVTVSRESLGPCGGHLNFTVEEVKTWEWGGSALCGQCEVRHWIQSVSKFLLPCG